MRFPNSLLTLACLSSVLAVAPPAAAHSDCTTFGGACTFTCDDGDTVSIYVYGTDVIPSSGRGEFACGTAEGGCAFTRWEPPFDCTAYDTSLTDGLGTCTLVTGSYARCTSSP